MIDLEKIKAKKSIKELLEFGIIVINKPAEWTSFDVSNYVCRSLHLKKTSHFGTLDPMVTGVLPVSLGRATKLTGFFLGEDKEYEGIMHMHEEVSLEDINKVIKEKFIGKIIQLPPVRSSVKRQEREREIKKFELLEKNGKDVKFLVECQGGTYVRKLVHDLGEQMNIGAHMIGLKRMRAGIFTEKDMTKKEDFEKAIEEYKNGNDKNLKKLIIPAEIVSNIYEPIQLKKEYAEKVLHGAPIMKDMVENKKKFEKNKIISIFKEDQFIGMFKVVNEGRTFALPMFVLQPIR